MWWYLYPHMTGKLTTSKSRVRQTAKQAKLKAAQRIEFHPLAGTVGQRLRQLIDDEYDGKPYRFARHLAAAPHPRGFRRVSIDTSNVSAWCGGGIIPSAETLAWLGLCADVSIDWLLGFDVPRRRSAREPVGDLAGELRSEVVRRHDRDAARSGWSGIADVVGGPDGVSEVETVDPNVRPVPQAGDLLPDGRVVVRRLEDGKRIQVLASDPAAFLDQVCAWASAEAVTSQARSSAGTKGFVEGANHVLAVLTAAERNDVDDRLWKVIRDRKREVTAERAARRRALLDAMK